MKSDKKTPKKAATAEPKSPRLTDSGLRPFGTWLPVAYLEILTRESELIGVRRGKLLELLLRRKYGQLNLERSSSAPKYSFTAEQLTTKEKFIWYVKPEVGEIFDKERLRMGDIPIQAWVILELNRWIGRPDGFQEKGGKYV